MTDDGVPELPEWVSVPNIATLYNISEVAVRRGIRDWKWYLIHPDPEQSEVVKVPFGKNRAYLVRKLAVDRVKRSRDLVDARKAAAHETSAQQELAMAWRGRFRRWANARGVTLRQRTSLPEELIGEYIKAYPGDKPPDGYDVVLRRSPRSDER